MTPGFKIDLDALSAYVTSLASIPRSPYRNADGSLTDDAQAGEILFHDLGCNSCHHGEDFTDSSLGNVHDVGTMTELSGNRLGGELPGIDTPTLLGVWQTAPYLHDGSAATLRDVLTTRNIENRHGETSELTEQQLDELVSYLEQLDHGLPPVVLTLPVDVGNMPGMGGSNGTGGEADPGDPGDPETPSTPPRSASASGCSCNLSKQVNAPRTNGALWALAISLAITWARRRTRRISSTGRLR